MPKAYPFIFFSHGLKRDSDVIWAESEAEAVQKAKEQFGAGELEVWDGQRIVAKLGPDE